MKAFWTIKPNLDGAPDLPSLPSMSVVNPCDIWILPSGAGAASHIHSLAGTMSFPSFQTSSRHTHAVLKTPADAAVHYHFHETEAYHAHPDPDLAFFMCFIVCSDSDYITLTSAPYNVRAIAHAVIEDEEITKQLDTTPWTAQERTFWFNASMNNLGIALPASIDRGARMVALFSQTFLARYGNNESGLR